MIGGEEEIFRRYEPIFKTLAPPDGYGYMGGHGAGHYVKMVHNGIEYGLMQAYAEGFEVMHKSDYKLDLPKIANLWGQGSVVRSWLLDAGGRSARKRSGAQANPRLRRRFGRGPLDGTGRNRQKHLDADHHDVAIHALSIARRQGRGHLRREAARRAARRVRRPRRRQGIEFERVSCFMAGLQTGPDFNHLHPVKERNHYDPCIIVIFGGAGDLSHRKLLPALYNLSIDGELPDKFAILGFSMEDLNDESYRQFAHDGIEQVLAPPGREEHWAKFAPMLHFIRGIVHRGGRLREPAQAARDDSTRELRHGGQSRVLLCDSAGVYRHLLGRIDGGGHDSRRPKQGHAFTRVVVEKPIGSDLASAVGDQRPSSRAISTRARSSASTITSARRRSRT